MHGGSDAGSHDDPGLYSDGQAVHVPPPQSQLHVLPLVDSAQNVVSEHGGFVFSELLQLDRATTTRSRPAFTMLKRTRASCRGHIAPSPEPSSDEAPPAGITAGSCTRTHRASSAPSAATASWYGR